MREAALRGHAVTALVRGATTFADQPAVRTVRGDVLDEAALRSALAGQDAVASALGLRRKNEFPYSRLTSPADLLSRSMALLVAAMRAEKISLLCAMSAAGVAESLSRTNFAMRFLIATSSVGAAYRDMTRMESLLAESGLDWTAVRPTTLTNGEKKNRVRETDRYSLISMIPRADVAAWMLDRLEHPEATPKTRTPMITG